MGLFDRWRRPAVSETAQVDPAEAPVGISMDVEGKDQRLAEIAHNIFNSMGEASKNFADRWKGAEATQADVPALEMDNIDPDAMYQSVMAQNFSEQPADSLLTHLHQHHLALEQ